MKNGLRKANKSQPTAGRRFRFTEKLRVVLYCSARVAGFCPLTVTMRSIVPLLVLVLLAFCGVSCRSTLTKDHSAGSAVHDPRATWTPMEGYEYLIVTRRFALGGVGFAGSTSTGEYAFRAILRSKGASGVFKLILSPGAQATEEGKLYALCGIRATDQAEFDRYAAIVVSTNAEVITQSGCIVSHDRAADVIKQIADGVYDWHYAKQ